MFVHTRCFEKQGWSSIIGDCCVDQQQLMSEALKFVVKSHRFTYNEWGTHKKDSFFYLIKIFFLNIENMKISKDKPLGPLTHISEHVPKSARCTLLFVLLVGCAVLGVLLLVCIGVLSAVAIPSYLSMHYKAKHTEVPTNLIGIKIAELQYESNNDEYVACKKYPRSSSGKKTQPWHKRNSGGFRTLGWMPDKDVQGQYWVTTTSTNFIATGIIDADGDGVFATYVATKSVYPLSPITGPDVY